jgi:hypothetical protein
MKLPQWFHLVSNFIRHFRFQLHIWMKPLCDPPRPSQIIMAVVLELGFKPSESRDRGAQIKFGRPRSHGVGRRVKTGFGQNLVVVAACLYSPLDFVSIAHGKIPAIRVMKHQVAHTRFDNE